MTTAHATTYWKAEINDLRSCAEAVWTSAIHTDAEMSARTAARVLHGVMSLVARRWSVDIMQRACAALVRYEAAWTSSFGLLPLEGDESPGRGVVRDAIEPMQMIAVVCRSLLPMAGKKNLQAAISFWAIESDAGVWNELVSGT